MQETITIVVQQSGQGPKRQNFVHEQQQVRGDVPHRRGVPQPRHVKGQRTKNSKQRPLPLAAQRISILVNANALLQHLPFPRHPCRFRLLQRRVQCGVGVGQVFGTGHFTPQVGFQRHWYSFAHPSIDFFRIGQQHLFPVFFHLHPFRQASVVPQRASSSSLGLGLFYFVLFCTSHGTTTCAATDALQVVRGRSG